LSQRPAPAASHLFYERLASDPTLCQKKLREFLPFGPAVLSRWDLGVRTSEPGAIGKHQVHNAR